MTKDRPTAKEADKDQERIMSQMPEKAMKTYEEAFRTGLKLQDEDGFLDRLDGRRTVECRGADAIQYSSD